MTIRGAGLVVGSAPLRCRPKRDGSGLATVAFAPDGQVLAAGCANGSVRLWDIVPGENPSPGRPE